MWNTRHSETLFICGSCERDCNETWIHPHTYVRACSYACSRVTWIWLSNVRRCWKGPKETGCLLCHADTVRLSISVVCAVLQSGVSDGGRHATAHVYGAKPHSISPITALAVRLTFGICYSSLFKLFTLTRILSISHRCQIWLICLHLVTALRSALSAYSAVSVVGANVAIKAGFAEQQVVTNSTVDEMWKRNLGSRRKGKFSMWR